MTTLGEIRRDTDTGWEIGSALDDFERAETTLHNLVRSLKGNPADQLQEGLPKAALDRLQDALGVSQKEVADSLMIPLRTLSRWDKLPTAESDRVLRFGMLFQRALEVLGNGRTARQWLQTPKRALDGQVPLALAKTELGARRVEDLLGQLEHGVFS